MYHHLTFSSVGRAPLACDPSQRLRLVRALTRIGGSRVLLFCVVDDHAHVLVEGDPGEITRLMRSVSHAWRACSGQALAPTDRREVEDRAYLLTLVDYLHRQPVRHALGVHPAAWNGSSLWDLVGARRLPGFDPGAIRRALPRLDTERVWRSVGLTGAPDLPTRGDLGEFRVAEVFAAASEALACEPARTRVAWVQATAVSVQLALAADQRPRRIAADLQIGERTVFRLAATQVDPAARAAVERQIALRHWLRSARPVLPTDSERRGIERSRLLAGAGSAELP